MSARTVVVLGASRNRGKYGNKAVRAYVTGGWTVYPVNPNTDIVEGLKSFRSLSSVPSPVERVTIYLRPEIALAELDEVVKLMPRETFFNPGSESSEVLEKATNLGLNPISACSIVDIGLSPSQFPG